MLYRLRGKICSQINLLRSYFPNVYKNFVIHILLWFVKMLDFMNIKTECLFHPLITLTAIAILPTETVDSTTDFGMKQNASFDATKKESLAQNEAIG